MLKRRSLFTLSSLSGLLAYFGGWTVSAAEGRVFLANGLLRMGVEPSSGAIVEFVDVATGHNFGQAGDGMWAIALGTNSVIPSHASRFRMESDLGERTSRMMTWSGFAPPAPAQLSVRVRVTLDPETGTARWRIGVEGLGNEELRQVRFPIFTDIPAQNKERLAVPMWMGQVAAEPRGLFKGKQNKRFKWDYPGELSMQCLAFYGDKAGLYIACDDTESYLKSFAAGGNDSGAIKLEVVHQPEAGVEHLKEWTQPYDVITGVFHGDWFSAAERYRAWATNQPWAVESRLAKRQVPDWVTNTALWVWNRGRSPGVLGPAVELRKQLGLPVSVFWHWWHGCAYDSGFPEYLPPREGEPEFQDALSKAQKRGVHALVYMNQRLWGMATASWTNEHAAIWAVKASDGQIKREIYNTFNKAPCASMCLGTAFWRGKYASLADRAIQELGVDGIYMDQACLSMACFDPAHGHPRGGGTYWVNGFRLLAADIRATATRQSATRPALAGEGCGEPWLSHLDLMLSLQVSRERYAAPDGWETIPFFHSVYHDKAVFFGNYSSLTMPPYDDLWPPEHAPKEPLKLLDRSFSRQFCLEQARAFVWGQQSTIANFLPEQFRTRPAEVAYVMQLATLRHGMRKYLLHGEMLRAPEVMVARRGIAMSRLSIYAGQQGGLKTFKKEVSMAVAGAWRATDRRVAIALATIADTRLPVTIKLPLSEYGIAGRCQMVRVDTTGRRNVGIVSPTNPLLELQMPPRTAWMLELEPVGGRK